MLVVLKIFLFNKWVKIPVDDRHKHMLSQLENESVDGSFFKTMATNHVTGVKDINDSLDAIKELQGM